jgi:hypothetical protein
MSQSMVAREAAVLMVIGFKKAGSRHPSRFEVVDLRDKGHPFAMPARLFPGWKPSMNPGALRVQFMGKKFRIDLDKEGEKQQW